MEIYKESKTKVQIITRIPPLENTGGSSEYLLRLIRLLIKENIHVQLIILTSKEPLFNPAFLIPADMQPISRFPFNTRRVGKHMARDNLVYTVSQLLFTAIYHSKSQLFDKYDNSMRVENLFKKVFKIFTNGKIPTRETTSDWKDNVTKRLVPEEIAFLKTCINSFQPDVLISNYAFSADIFDNIHDERILRIILAHDLFKSRIQSFNKIGVQPDIKESVIESEAKLLRKADVVVTIQNAEATTLRKSGLKCEIITVPMPAIIKEPEGRPVKGRCLFVGSNALHNVTGIKWFIQKVWPMIIERNPLCTLHICGNVCRSITKHDRNTRLFGRVEDLSNQYSEAEVCVVPLIAGSGLKIKMIEAFSFGRVCVTTSVGAEGMKHLKDLSITIADNERDFANAVVDLVESNEKRKTMEKNALEFASMHLSPDIVYAPLIYKIREHTCKGDCTIKWP